jgi:hypothetical protein
MQGTVPGLQREGFVNYRLLYPILAVVEWLIILLRLWGNIMSYVPDYKWDVFVSFANNDNDAAQQKDRWVNRFVSDLKIGIKNWVGNADKLAVFFEIDTLPAGTELDTLQEYARSSAIFIAVVSPSYIKRNWTLHELSAFSGSGDSSGRLIAIECRPVGDYENLPDRLRKISVKPFFIQDPGEAASRPLSPKQDTRAWMNRMEALTKDIAALLEKIKTGKSQNVQGPKPVKRTVLLAQTTDDMSDECEDVRRYLTQAGHTVLPAQNYYPQGGEEFKTAFRSDLGQADLYVQLLGLKKARRDPALPEGYTRFQFEAAKEAARVRPKLKTFIWRPANINIDEVKHEDAGILRESTVTAMTLESFKKEVESSIERSGNGANSTIVINAAPNDQEIAGAVSDECSLQGFTAFMPSSERSAEKSFQQVKGCSAYFLVFGKADEDWAIRQGVLFSKISAELSEADLPKMVAIIDGPPEEKSPPPIRLPHSSVINCRKSMDPVRQVLTGLRQ